MFTLINKLVKMIKVSFKTLDDLTSFLEDGGFSEVRFCVNPDYVDAIIGVSDEYKVVYDYDKMVEHLAKIYAKDDKCSDPYTDACEWIDYNCDIPYWEIVTRDKDDYVPLEENNPDFYKRFSDYKKYIIGMNTYGSLLIDSEYITDQIIDDMESILDEFEIDYKII